MQATDKKRAGRPTQAESERRIENLLEVAATMFIDGGYQATSLDAIALTAGVAKRTIYARYPDKAALFEAVLHRLTARGRIGNFPRVVEATLSEGLRRYAYAIVENSTRPEGVALHRLLYREGPLFRELGQTMWHSVEKFYGGMLAEYFETHRKAGNLGDIDPATAARFFIYLLFGDLNWRLLFLDTLPTPAEKEAFISDAIKIFVNGIARRDPAPPADDQ